MARKKNTITLSMIKAHGENTIKLLAQKGSKLKPYEFERILSENG